ncbi:ABC transporter substrate-binding protein [Rickettsiales endosymbiont of Stachyamoeba lipophora]|uniref:ABC transporter substrate-binding protein n=1 Tax=Rickettsiales endosymbiont of Stachyamoeba lipophora TaxID=2486578 RepID=UPI000F64C50F|nr:extracellular solute-binding protein [Rickettsiales endosymbiont of Stachyamoeba lipophora]AZL15841.1 extracellular solute-binding protein [Rickettsiales endosymbiont of Stachyamoeba lipophora]
MFKIFVLLLLSCCNLAVASQQSINIYNWAESLNPRIVNDFSHEYAIKVNYDLFDNDHLMESKLALARNIYDITGPGIFPFVEKYANDGIFKEIDINRLKNYHLIDSNILQFLKIHKIDKYTVPWVWGVLAIGYHQEKLKQFAPDFDPTNLNDIFDINKMRAVSKCGISIMDSPLDISGLALLNLKKNPNSNNIEDYIQAFKLLKKIAPFVHNFNSSKYTEEFANEDSCLVIGDSIDILTIMDKTHNPHLKLALPSQGTFIFILGFVINPNTTKLQEAYQFIDYILEPKNALKNVENVKVFSSLDAQYLDKAKLPATQFLINEDYFQKLHISRKRSKKIENWVNSEWQKIISLK